MQWFENRFVRVRSLVNLWAPFGSILGSVLGQVFKCFSGFFIVPTSTGNVDFVCFLQDLVALGLLWSAPAEALKVVLLFSAHVLGSRTVPETEPVAIK